MAAVSRTPASNFSSLGMDVMNNSSDVILGVCGAKDLAAKDDLITEKELELLSSALIRPGLSVQLNLISDDMSGGKVSCFTG